MISLAPLSARAQPAPLKGSLGQPAEDRRTYLVDGAEVQLAPPRDLSDEELIAFLQAIKWGRVVWAELPSPPRRLGLADIDFVGASGSPRLYHIFIRPEPPARSPFLQGAPITTILDAEFDSGVVRITRTLRVRH